MAEKYEIVLLEADKFGYIKFKVMDAPIVLMDLEVYFESGKKQYIDVKSLIKDPGESWVIKLNAGNRNITKVVFVYKTLPNHKDEKALVQLWDFCFNNPVTGKLATSGIKTYQDEKEKRVIVRCTTIYNDDLFICSLFIKELNVNQAVQGSG